MEYCIIPSKYLFIHAIILQLNDNNGDIFIIFMFILMIYVILFDIYSKIEVIFNHIYIIPQYIYEFYIHMFTIAGPKFWQYK